MPPGNTFTATRPTLFFLPCLELGLRIRVVPQLIISTAPLFSRSRLVAKLKITKAFAQWSRIHKRRTKRHVRRPWSRGFFFFFFFCICSRANAQDYISFTLSRLFLKCKVCFHIAWEIFDSNSSHQILQRNHVADNNSLRNR